MKNTYTEMKNSGVVWLGNIPRHWQLTDIGSLYTQRNERVSDKDYAPLSVTKQGILPQLSTVAKTDDGDNRKLVKCGDFVINSRSDRRGACGISPYDGSVSLINTVLSPRGKMHPGYFDWLFHTEAFADEFYKWGHGIVDDLWTTRWAEMKQIVIPVPEFTTQAAIAAYLDENCGAIDEIIAEAKASIEEYKAWKSSVIFEAVTKGLNPNAEMKDSGVEWIGKVPRHWKVCTLKRLCSQITDGSHFSPETVDDGFPYITAGDVSGKGLNYAATKKISTEDFENLQRAGCRPYKGDVLLVKDGATTGRTGLMIDDTPCVALSSVAILRPAATVNSAFLMYMMMSELLQFQIRMSMAGSAMPRTTLSKLVEYKALFCENEEQLDIVKYLDEKCATIDGIIAEKEALIADMEAYKKSLIFETVTGKRKVC